MIASSELVLNDDGSIYHLHLQPENIAPTIITVGDPDRVAMVSKYFDHIEFATQKREFVTHTGRVGNKRLTVISTGIGTDNIDIVLNELDALVNIDLKTRTPLPETTQLTIVRLGTSGSLHPDIPVDSIVVSSFGLGFDGLLHYYHFQPDETENKLLAHFPTLQNGIVPYIARASQTLLSNFQHRFTTGITATCSGFYGPQGRQLRLQPALPQLLTQLQQFSDRHHRVTNFEMETAAIYGLSRLLGHRALSVNVIMANRALGMFSPNPYKAIDHLIQTTLPLIAGL
ncbi:phosphorylase [Sphingobacteriales bacterium UPWRP_1]|nr:phosphorylase [Sphingobacteriales bacterium TSM_CSM]PSJ74511.1 phosphorylase [Sphingobacteriales bacterium UPWRP_1]